MTTSPADQPACLESAPHRGLRWRPALLIVLAGGGWLTWIWSDAEAAPAKQITNSYMAGGLSLMALVAWFVLFSRARFALRWGTFLVLVLLGGLTAATRRIDGVTGDIVPITSWRWSPRPGERPTSAGLRSNTGNAAHGNGESDAPVDLTAATSEDYPQFLGPRRYPELPSIRLNADWGAHPPRVVWRQAIGQGWSSFAIVGPYALTQEQIGPDEAVVCYELKSGRRLWSHTDPARFDKVIAGAGPRGTPTVANGRVFTSGATGILNCLDGATGTPIWRHEILEENCDATRAEFLTWGYSASPLVHDGLVIINPGGAEGRSLAAYDETTGKLRWHGGNAPASYSSPFFATLAGAPQIVIFTGDSIAGHDPHDGSVLWQFPWQGANPNVAQPIPVGDNRLFVSTGYGIGCVLLELAPLENGKQAVSEIWRNLKMKIKFSNAVVRDGHLYGLDEGILACLDLADGRQKWKSGRYGHGQVLLFENCLLVQAEAGYLALVEPRPDKFVELARSEALAGKTWNNPAFSSPYLLVRNDQEAICYELALEASPAATTAPAEPVNE